MTKRKELKNKLKGGKLLDTMNGGAIIGQGSDSFTYTGGTITVNDLINNVKGNITNIASLETLLGFGDPLIVPTISAPLDGLTYLANYQTKEVPSKYIPTVNEFGLLPWIADQIKMGVTYTGPTPIGTNFTASGLTAFKNRFLTLEDLIGIGTNNNLRDDVQAAIDHGPIAQFKNLPAVAHLT